MEHVNPKADNWSGKCLLIAFITIIQPTKKQFIFKNYIVIISKEEILKLIEKLANQVNLEAIKLAVESASALMATTMIHQINYVGLVIILGFYN